MLPDKFSIHKNGEELPIQGKKHMQDIIHDILGYTKKELSQMTFFSLDFYKPYMTMDSNEKKVFMREFFNIEIYDDIRELVKVESKSTVDLYNKLDLTLSIDQENLEKLRASYKEGKAILKLKIKKWKEERDKIKVDIKALQSKKKKTGFEEMDLSISDIFDKRSTLKAKLESLNREIKQYKNDISKHRDKLNNIKLLKAQLKDENIKESDLKKLRDQINDEIKVQDDMRKINQEINDHKNNLKDIKYKISSNDNLKDEIEEVEGTYAELEKKLIKLTNDRKLVVEVKKPNKTEDYDYIIKDNKRLLKNLKEEEEFFNTHTVCPTCSQDITDDFIKRKLSEIKTATKNAEGEVLGYISMRDLYNTQLEEYNTFISDGEKFKNKYEVLSENLKNKRSFIDDQIRKLIEPNELYKLQTTKDKLSDKINIKKDEYDILYNKYKTTQLKIEKLKKYEDIIDKINKLTDSAEGFNESKIQDIIDYNLYKIDEYNTELDKVNLVVADYYNQKEKHNDYNNQIGDLSAEVLELKKKIQIARNDIDNLKSIIDDKKNVIVDVKKKIKEQQTEKDIIDYLNHSVSAIKSYIINKYVPSINSLLYKYSTIIESKFNLTMSNDGMDIEVFEYGNKVKYFTCSSGERNQINLIILLAFIELSRLKNGGNFNLLLLDEITAPLDETNTYKMFSLLKTYFSNLKILLISHKSIDKELGSFIDGSIDVSLKDGFSNYKIK
jgi:DNA repair exonuclease SbcCD ATPase subunit